MFRLLKRLVLRLCFICVRPSKRERLLKNLLPSSKKHMLDILAIPSALDEITQLPKAYKDSASFVGLDHQGLCVRTTVGRTRSGCHVL